MRPFILFALATCFAISSFAPIPVTNDQDRLSEVDRLFYTCKIWGYLKYYHPLVSKGSYNWDEKLQSVLTKTANIQTFDSYSNYMHRWIYYMGQVPPCTTCRQQGADEVFLKNFDLSWTQNNKFSGELKNTLKNIENNRYQGSNFYVNVGNIGQFEPNNEGPDYNYNWEDKYQRLLPLFRYWNIIEYFYPYKYLTEQSWGDVLKEMIPKFMNVESRLDFHLVMMELVTKVNDSNAIFMTPLIDEMPYFNYLAARFEVIEDQVVITELIDKEKAMASDLQVGDILTSVNGQSAMALHNSHKKHISGSNEAAVDRSIYQTLFMGMKGPVTLVIDRNGSQKSLSVPLYKSSDLKYTPDTSQQKWEAISDSIAYVNMGMIGVSDVAPMMEELMDSYYLIFDVRNSPKGTYKAISKYLNPNDTTFVRYLKPDYSYPGKYVWKGGGSCGENNPDYYKGKVILLVNEKTQNHGEFTCMALQTAPDALVIGSQTGGTDGKVTRFAILKRFYTTMTGIGVYYPDKSEAQRVGITPDITVSPTIDGIRDGHDEPLEKAIEFAETEIRQAALLRAALAKAAMDSIARLDSLRMDSLRMDSLIVAPPVDSLLMDTTDDDY